MRSFRRSCLYILACTLAFFPVFTFAGEALKLRLYFRQSSVCAVVVAVICAICVLLSPRREDGPSLPRRILTDLLCPLTILCWVAFLIRGMTATVLICMTLCLICAMLLCSRIDAGKGKITGMVIGILAAFPLFLFSGMVLLFDGSSGGNTVVKTLPSPDGHYCAHVIDSDQGALGGDTLVDVHAQPCLDAGLFYMARTPQRVFIDDHGVWKTMEIFWQDDTTLVINGESHLIG